MSYKGLLSNIIITILVVCSILMLIMLYSSGSPFDVLDDPIETPENAGMIMLLPMLLVAAMLAIFLAFPLVIALLHGICLIFTIKNRKAERRDLRIWGHVLSALNACVILASLFLIVLWLFIL